VPVVPSSPLSSLPALRAARSYARLEAELRARIDRLTARVCPGCRSPCCRPVYCRKTFDNPWYRWVNRVCRPFVPPPEWRVTRQPFGLGPRDCEIRAGRYVFCYSFNCRRLLAALPEPGARRAFQALSDLLLHPDRLPGGRRLHELGPGERLSRREVGAIDRALAEARQALVVLDASGMLPPAGTRLKPEAP